MNVTVQVAPKAAPSEPVSERPPASPPPVPASAFTQISTAALRELADIVGSRDVSADRAIVSGYAWCYNGMRGDPPERLISPIKAAAVVLPESAEEVQAVVQACLRHGLKFRAHSTGLGSFPNAANLGTVIVDLRKMDRIVKLDAKNQMAIVEPYVTCAQLQAEGMKVGLTTHIVGAGWTHSPLASATSFMGVGPSSNHTGNNPRNLLALEWVTPQGELVRLGSAGQDSSQWFAGEGPGPGFRGMIRGYMGGMGELGIFTKIGYKLHPWMGPAKLEHCGSNPQFGIKLSDTMRLYHLVWQDWEAMTKATYHLLRSNAATFIGRQPPDQIGWMLYPTNREFYDRWTSGDIAPVAQNKNRIAWTLMTVSESLAQAEWRERVIRRIGEETGAEFLALDQSHAEALARNVLTSCYVPRIYRSAARGVFTSVGVMDSPGLLPEVMTTVAATVKPYKEKYKTFVAGSPENMWMWTSEGRQLWGENAISADNCKVRSWADMMAFSLDYTASHARRPLGINAFIGTNDLIDTFLAHFKTNIWLRRLKEVIDPGRNSDGRSMPFGPLSTFPKKWPMLRVLQKRAPLLLRMALRGKIRKASRAAVKKAQQTTK